MKQGGFARAARIEDREVTKIKTKAAREKKHKCAVRTCRAEFVRPAPFVTWCSPECGTALALAKLEKHKQAAARAERVATREKLAKFKSKRDHLADCQRAFNAYIRFRDRDEPCICCDRASTGVDGLGAHGWDAGHYRSVGSAPHLRFHEQNVHKQLVLCNRYGAGRAVEYRAGLIARIGLDAVEALERDQEPRHYTVDQLIALTAHYKQKLKELKAAAA
ncbi:hypothetical protein GTP38_11240 [Duganella sp. FT94W]|uniref:NinG protein n=2 Tax=Duganella lactea TaxID=2692173 RepID=A0ABW9V8A3_9BURK|nr:hypothetical protein [Duganella lactea]